MPQKVTIDDASERWVRAALGEFGDSDHLDYEDPAYDYMYVRRYRDGRKFLLMPRAKGDFAEHPLPARFVPIAERSYAALSFPEDQQLAQRRVMAELIEMREMGIGIVYRDDKLGCLVRDFGNGRRMALDPKDEGGFSERLIEEDPRA